MAITINNTGWTELVEGAASGTLTNVSSREVYYLQCHDQIAAGVAIPLPTGGIAYVRPGAVKKYDVASGVKVYGRVARKSDGPDEVQSMIIVT